MLAPLLYKEGHSQRRYIYLISAQLHEGIRTTARGGERAPVGSLLTPIVESPELDFC